jgi:hypothetical protein
MNTWEVGEELGTKNWGVVEKTVSGLFSLAFRPSSPNKDKFFRFRAALREAEKC